MTLTNLDRALTTFETAKVCGVFHTTVINWVNKGLLPARYTPGGHRRIAVSDLVAFMKQFKMPIPDDLVNQPKKLLVVEDDAAVARMVERAFGALPNIEVKKCASGLEALMIIGKEAPDLVVLDIRIPQVNGVEVCRLIKHWPHTQQIKIIAVSGDSLAADEQKVISADADAFLKKPLSTGELRQLATKLLELDVEA